MTSANPTKPVKPKVTIMTDPEEESTPEEDVVEKASEETESDEEFDLNDIDPEEEFWPSGPTVGMIKEWKDEHGKIYVTSVTLEDHIVWRPINRVEYKNHVRRMQQMQQAGKLKEEDATTYNEEVVAKLCILYGHEQIEALGGVATLITQQVLEASGFQALEVREL